MNDDMIILQTDHVTSSARVRDNQRRSRARRKEYTLGLEERLRRFESLGVEVTREVQAAGRKVAAENALLWSLLRHHALPTWGVHFRSPLLEQLHRLRRPLNARNHRLPKPSSLDFRDYPVVIMILQCV